MDKKLAISAILLIFGILLFGCAQKSGCDYGNPTCPENYSCSSNSCVPREGCAYGRPACEWNYSCEDNTCIANSGCDYANPRCPENHDCINNTCVMKKGCEYGNPACKENYSCVGNTCVLMEGCSYSAPSCAADEDCVNNQCVKKSGCAYNNPTCGAGYSCVNNQCVQNQGCAYNNPACQSGYNCVNNECVMGSGCDYSNPPCGFGYACSKNSCMPTTQVISSDEISANYQSATSWQIDLNRLPKLNPDAHGFTYDFDSTIGRNLPMSVGDGFGKGGGWRLKFVDFSNGAKFQLFKVERDNNFYPYPTMENKNIYFPGITAPAGILLQIAPESQQNTSVKIFTPTSDCTYMFGNPQSRYYEPDPAIRSGRCPFDAFAGEEKFTDGKFSVVLPTGYAELGQFTVAMLKQCYEKEVALLGFDPEKPRVGFKMQTGQVGTGTGTDEYILMGLYSKDYIDANYVAKLPQLKEELAEGKCSNVFVIGHEMAHLLTKGMFGGWGKGNYGLAEGFATFVDHQVTAYSSPTARCYDNGFIPGDMQNSVIQPYANLSTWPSDSGAPKDPSDYYFTGACFYADFIKEYGYQKFVDFMRELYTRSRGIDNFYIWDVMTAAIGGQLDPALAARYSLTRESTLVPDVCYKCDMFR